MVEVSRRSVGALVLCACLWAGDRAVGGAHEACLSCHGASGGASGGPGGDSSASGACLPCHESVRLPDTRARLDDRDRDRPWPGHVASARLASPSATDPESAILGSSCLTCHDPHASSSPKLLRQAADETGGFDGALDRGSRLCIACHPRHGRWRGGRSGYARHPVGIRVARERLVPDAEVSLHLVDTRGTEDPGDDQIACLTCHDVHASSREHLERWREGESAAWCTACHSVSGEPRGPRLRASIRSRLGTNPP
jgi:predicted CXXCH cytochrome family protein